MENNPDAKGKVKLIGIGVTNDAFEVEYFRKTYNVPFPLFEDEDSVILEQLGIKATPFFIGVKINHDGTHQVFYTHLGGFEQADQFLDEILKGSGLK
ncbi:MAG: TlpA family protein disulfide reductase [Desulfatiglandales bacterium]